MPKVRENIIGDTLILFTVKNLPKRIEILNRTAVQDRFRDRYFEFEQWNAMPLVALVISVFPSHLLLLGSLIQEITQTKLMDSASVQTVVTCMTADVLFLRSPKVTYDQKQSLLGKMDQSEFAGYYIKLVKQLTQTHIVGSIEHIGQT